jgi:hypothetical protein
LFIEAAPEVAVAFVQHLLDSTSAMTDVELHGHCYGKNSSLAEASEIRAIIPLPCVLQIADALFAKRLHDFIDEKLPLAPGCWVGARPYTQILDIANGLHLVVEKGLDLH